MYCMHPQQGLKQYIHALSIYILNSMPKQVDSHGDNVCIQTSRKVEKYHRLKHKMGCLCTRDVERENQIDFTRKKVYSWDLRKDSNINPQNFIFESLVNDEVIEIPGSINGNQFLIRNCSNSVIYVLDHMNTVTIDDCVNCKIVMGPVKGSVYIRDCTNCICVVACGQLRIRDSRRVWAFLHCETQPVLETSTAIYFGSYQLKYKQLEQHFKDANLNEERKTCEFAHDFTPVQNENNWKFIEDDNAYDYIKDPSSEEVLQKLRECEQTWFFSDTNGLKRKNLSKASFSVDEFA